ATHCLWTASTSSTHTDIQAPLSAVSSPPGPKVAAFAPRPRLPCPPRQRKISHSPDPTDPNVGGVPQSQHFLQPHFSNHAKLAALSDTFRIGVMAFAFMEEGYSIFPLLERSLPAARSGNERHLFTRLLRFRRSSPRAPKPA